MSQKAEMAEDLIRWEDRYCLGLPEIDEQHQSLVVLINDIWQAIVKRSDATTVFGLVGELERYTLAHFAAEETFMRITNYPEFEQHKQEHQTFVARIAEEKARAMSVGTLSLQLMHFLRDWLLDHILASDKAYVVFTQQTPTKSRSWLGRFFKRIL